MTNLTPQVQNLLALLAFLIPILSFFWKLRDDIKRANEQREIGFTTLKRQLESLKEIHQDSHVLLTEVVRENTHVLRDLKRFLKNRFDLEDRLAQFKQTAHIPPAQPGVSR